MKRHDEWEYRLGQFARKHLGKSFRWGKTDCGSLAMGAIKAIYGPGAKPKSVGSYTGRKTAESVVGGLGDLREVLAGMGAQAYGMNFAQPGDIIILHLEEEALPFLGVCLGTHVLTTSPSEGVEKIPAFGNPLLEDATAMRLPHG